MLDRNIYRGQCLGMNLRTWLEQTDTTQAEFAARVGVTQSAVARWCGGVVPLPRHWRAIREVTDGAVTPEDFLEEAQAGRG
jgi:transcriptional regulator with XRE-family HTH domain